VTVALAEGAPVTSGRTWTAEEYAKRDAALVALGITFRRSAAHRAITGDSDDA